MNQALVIRLGVEPWVCWSDLSYIVVWLSIILSPSMSGVSLDHEVSFSITRDASQSKSTSPRIKKVQNLARIQNHRLLCGGSEVVKCGIVYIYTSAIAAVLA